MTDQFLDEQTIYSQGLFLQDVCEGFSSHVCDQI